MKRNMFGEAIAQPGDDLGSVLEAHDIDACADVEVLPESIELDPSFGWTATLQAYDDGSDDVVEVQVHDFTSEEELRTYLRERHVRGV